MEALHPSAGDPPGIETLIEYEPFVRAVARGLLSDEAAVDDIVQETWTRAIRRPPSHGGAIKAWLARIVRNLAMDLRRGEGRRKQREQLAGEPQGDVEPVDELQSRLEAHQEVIAAVLALDEPYQSVVMLTYYQGMSPADVAVKLGRKPATVRTQLCRAHELLRERLDREFGGNRAAWAILAVPFSWPAAPLPAGPGGGGVAGGLGMGVKLLLGAVLATALVVVPDWSGASSRDGEGVGGLELAGAQVPDAPGGAFGLPAEERGERALVAAPDRSKAAAAGAAPAIRVRVVDAAGVPLAGVPVVLGVGVSRERFEDVVMERTGSGPAVFRDFEESLTFAGQPTTIYRVRAAIPALDRDAVLVGVPAGALRVDRELEVAMGPTAPVTIELRRADGELFDFEGEVILTLKGQVESMPPSAALSAGRASFPWVGLGGQLAVAVRVPSLGLSWSFSAAGPVRAGEPFVVAFAPQIDADLPWISGRALTPDGAPLASTRLRLSLLTLEREELQRSRIETDAQGHFMAQLDGGFEPGEELLVRLLRRGDASWDGRARSTLILAERANLLGDLVVFDIASSISGMCVDLQGRPVAGVQIVAPQDYHGIVSRSVSGQAGGFSMHGLFADEVPLRVVSPVWALLEETLAVPGGEGLQLRLGRGGRISGTLLVAGGVDPASFRATATREGAHPLDFVGPDALAAVHPETGAFTLKGLASGRYTCRVFRRGELVAEFPGLEVERPGQVLLDTIDLSDRYEALDFNVLDPNGRAARGIVAQLFDGDKLIDRATSDDGRIGLVFQRTVANPLLTIEAKASRPLILHPLQGLAPLGTVQLEACLEVRIEMTHVPILAAGEVRASVFLEWLDAPEPLEVAVPLTKSLIEAQGGKLRLPGPGNWRLAVVLRRPGGDTPRRPYGNGDYIIHVDESDLATPVPLALPPSLIR